MLKNHKIRHINALAFIILAFIFLPITNDDLLYAWQEYSLFIKGNTFMKEMLAEHGFWAWIGCYLTQYFYHPWLGSSMLIAIWVASYYLITDAFKLKDELSTLALIPLTCFLVSIIEVGYWIYYLDDPGYCFSYSIIFFAASICMWIVSKFKIPYKILVSLIGIILMVLMGIRYSAFKHGSYESYMMAIPFYAAEGSLIIIALADKINISNKAVATGIMSGLFATMGAICNIANVSDNNFHAELNMYKALDESRYEDVITEAESVKGEPTNLMVLYKNIALLHTNRLTDMFKINNCGTLPNVDDDLNVRIAQISGEMVYYQFGQINYAYRWAIENSVKHGMTNARLKMLIRCAIFNQEFDVAFKYLTLLKSTAFYRNWALEREKYMMRGADFYKSDEYQNISPLIADDINYLDRDGGLCEKWILNHFSDLIRPTSQKLEDLIMCTALWTEDEYSFLIHFYDYYQNHASQPIPELYQEALILLANSETSPITLNDFPFDSKIMERYNNFASDYSSFAQQGLKPDEIGAKMKAHYGSTYWWYYYFYTDFNIY